MDFSNRQELELALEGAIATARDIVFLDLRFLRFIDSAGLHVIIAADRKARNSGNRLLIVRGDSRIQQLFSLTRTEEHLTFIDAMPGEEQPAATLL